MAERGKRAARWLGLVTDDRYAEYEVDDVERTEGLSREELMGAQERVAAGGGGGSVTTLQSKPPTPTTIASAPVAAAASPLVTQTAAPAPAPRPRTADMS